MDYEDLELDEIDCAPVEATGERLAVLTLEEAHDLLDLLQAVAAEDGQLSAEAGRRPGRSPPGSRRRTDRWQAAVPAC
ncbi:DUF6417 family protein [Streptomyces brasiliensis]|uniref:Uncharacterized protein n=1 Tax=Streptomyces brasiliensis TaxID=1954 RepID=A0A917PCF5_9ACTN|nr:DUF6417 family protein [Streptomyces brasiliensis]GGJ70527.1 hypothetical protein GCM10010121_096440 [Streptomyces brasiliensis]